MNTSIDDLRLFTQTVLHGGISAAAKANNLQRSKVSRRLQVLESSLGCELLIRTTKTIELTEHGKYLYDLVSQQVHHIEHGIIAMKESQQDFTGTLRLALPSALMTSQAFTSAITEYSSRFPNIQIEVENHQDSVDLKRQAFDLQVLPNVVSITDDSYIQFSLIPYRCHLVASREYLNSHSPLTSVNDLRSHRVFTNRYNADLLEHDLHISLKSDDLNLLQSLALNSQGIAFLPTVHSRKAIEDGRLVQVLPNITYPSLHLTMIYPSAQFLSKKTRAFIDLFKELIS
ncbi:LysR family transcriptional regulator [Vibrio sp. ZSDE26]|uniref:LysR family transcriptional regulator n=1 Tax=Vibrio amylolyticus TaxID=2847292 RepID=A0A9X2BH45_9VIBR|nr:LysR family transcriptional regulator [Vibrio amylolyticus]MCK6263479.1 LysR family transcriptional regulator [Vibrio amylolyticus]